MLLLRGPAASCRSPAVGHVVRWAREPRKWIDSRIVLWSDSNKGEASFGRRVERGPTRATPRRRPYPPRRQDRVGGRVARGLSESQNDATYLKSAASEPPGE